MSGGYIEFEDWTADWLDRTHDGLRKETLVASCVLSALTAALGIRTMLGLRRTRKELQQNPSARAAILAENNKRLYTANKAHMFLSYAWLMHGMAIWGFDLGLFIHAMMEYDYSSPVLQGTPSEWIEVASMVALCIVGVVVVPRVQMMGLAYALARVGRHSADVIQSHVLPEACTASTQFAQAWSIIFFFTTALWSTFEHTTARLFVLQSAIFSALFWLNASSTLNFSPEKVAESIEEASGRSARPALYVLFRTAHRATVAVQLPQDEPKIDEKAALL